MQWPNGECIRLWIGGLHTLCVGEGEVVSDLDGDNAIRILFEAYLTVAKHNTLTLITVYLYQYIFFQ